MEAGTFRKMKGERYTERGLEMRASKLGGCLTEVGKHRMLAMQTPEEEHLNY